MPYNKLFNEILKFGNFEDFAGFACFIGRMRNLSIFNAALIFCQRPGALWVETEDGWAKHERYLKPNALPITILKPFAPVEFVYEYEDTDGEPLPFLSQNEKHAKIDELNGVSLGYVAERLREKLIYFAEKPMGELQFGYIHIPEENITIEKYVKSKDVYVNVPAQYALILNTNKSVSQKYMTIIHELGHLFCGHLPVPEDDENNKNRLVKHDRSNLHRDAKEHEAEAVCKLFCERINVEYDNYEYLKGYREQGIAPEIDYNVVITATDQICRLLGVF